MIITAVILAGTAFADGLGTVHFLKKGLDEQNPLFGKYPSMFRLFGEGTALIALEIAAVALMAHASHTVGLFGQIGLLCQAAVHLDRAIYNFKL